MKNSFVKDLAIAIISGLVIAAVYEWYKVKQNGSSGGSLFTDITNAFLHPINTLNQDVSLLGGGAAGNTSNTGSQGMGNGPGGTYNHTNSDTS